MFKMNRLLAAFAVGTAVAGSAFAVPGKDFEFNGYFRSGAGTSSEGGKEVCFRLPGSIVWFRLGNECDTYAGLTFNARLGEVDGTTFKGTFTLAYGTQQLANWEQSSPAFREAFVEAKDIGAGLNVAGLRGASLWAGKRYYKNPDIHMLDYTYWEPAQGGGFGLDNVDVGVGKFAYALLRIGDFTGYGINTSLGGFNPDIIGGGSRTASVHDFRLEDIAVNPGGKLTLGLDLIMKNNHDGTSSYSQWVPTTITQADGTPITVLAQQTTTIDNTKAKNGLGITISHKQENLFGLGGFNQVVFQYAKDAASLKGFGFAGSSDKRKEWLLFDHWVVEPAGSPFTASATVGLRNATINDKNVKDFWIGARPEYHINNIWSLMSEIGYQQVKPEGEDTRKLTKLTLGTQFSMGRSIWARPSLRFYTTYAKWNDAAAKAGSVVCTGRDCNTAVPAYNDKRSGLSYGVQVEAWF